MIGDISQASIQREALAQQKAAQDVQIEMQRNSLALQQMQIGIQAAQALVSNVEKMPEFKDALAYGVNYLVRVIATVDNTAGKDSL